MFKLSLFILGVLLSVPAYGIGIFTPDDDPTAVHNYTSPSIRYLKDLTIPACDVIISETGAGEGETAYDDVDFAGADNVYCFTPGDYRGDVTDPADGNRLNLGNVSGTEGTRKWLLYHDPDASEEGWQLLDSRRVHPYQRAVDKRAVLWQLLLNGITGTYNRWWVISGLNFEWKAVNGLSDYQIGIHGDDIIFDFYDVKNLWTPPEVPVDPQMSHASMIIIGSSSSTILPTTWEPDFEGPARITIQRNTLHDLLSGHANNDTVAVAYAAAYYNTVDYPDNVVVDNDIWDNNQAVQFVADAGGQSSVEGPGHFSDNVVTGNHFWTTTDWDVPCDWVTEDDYTSPPFGTGNCNCSEGGGLYAKSGGTIGKPLVISNNLGKHGRPLPDNEGIGDSCGGSGSNGQLMFTAAVLAEHIVYTRNIFWDQSYGYFGWAGTNTELTFNRWGEWAYDPGAPEHATRGMEQNLFGFQEDNGKIYGNLVSGASVDISPSKTKMGVMGPASGDQWIDMQCNVFLAQVASLGYQVKGDQLYSESNYVYTDIDWGDAKESGTNVMETNRTDDDTLSVITLPASAANMSDYCVRWKRWAGAGGKPEVYCIPELKTTSDSPHANHCDEASDYFPYRGGGASDGCGKGTGVHTLDSRDCYHKCTNCDGR